MDYVCYVVFNSAAVFICVASSPKLSRVLIFKFHQSDKREQPQRLLGVSARARQSAVIYAQKVSCAFLIITLLHSCLVCVFDLSFHFLIWDVLSIICLIHRNTFFYVIFIKHIKKQE